MKSSLSVLPISLALSAPPAKAGGFDQTLTLQGIHFRVTSANHGSVDTLRIVPSGRLKQGVPIEQEIMGTGRGRKLPTSMPMAGRKFTSMSPRLAAAPTAAYMVTQ